MTNKTPAEKLQIIYRESTKRLEELLKIPIDKRPQYFTTKGPAPKIGDHGTAFEMYVEDEDLPLEWRPIKTIDLFYPFEEICQCCRGSGFWRNSRKVYEKCCHCNGDQVLNREVSGRIIASLFRFYTHQVRFPERELWHDVQTGPNQHPFIGSVPAVHRAHVLWGHLVNRVQDYNTQNKTNYKVPPLPPKIEPALRVFTEDCGTQTDEFELNPKPKLSAPADFEKQIGIPTTLREAERSKTGTIPFVQPEVPNNPSPLHSRRPFHTPKLTGPTKPLRPIKVPDDLLKPKRMTSVPAPAKTPETPVKPTPYVPIPMVKLNPEKPPQPKPDRPAELLLTCENPTLLLDFLEKYENQLPANVQVYSFNKK